jgi:hypothetical protein
MPEILTNIQTALLSAHDALQAFIPSLQKRALFA